MSILPVFLHVPRSGGTYILNSLLRIARRAENNKNINYVFPHGKRYRVLTDDFSSNRTLIHSVGSSGFRTFREDLNDLYPNTSFKYYMILRNPLDRLYSHFKYIKSKKSEHEPTHQAISFDTFEEWIINSPKSHGDFNWLIRQLVGSGNREITQADYYRTFHEIKNFNVYLMEDIEVCIRDICKVRRWPYIPTDPFMKMKTLNNSEAKDSIIFQDMDNDFKKNFTEKNLWDLNLYSKFLLYHTEQKKKRRPGLRANLEEL